MINDAGLKLIKSFEGLRLKAYQDQIGKLTIGYGSTRDVKPCELISEAEAEARLIKDCGYAESAVHGLVTVSINDNQLAALVSFVYNLGPTNLFRSTLLGLLNRGDYGGAADEFLPWDKVGGVRSPGLLRRRRAERALFLTDIPDAGPPQSQST